MDIGTSFINQFKKEAHCLKILQFLEILGTRKSEHVI